MKGLPSSIKDPPTPPSTHIHSAFNLFRQTVETFSWAELVQQQRWALHSMLLAHRTCFSEADP